jgi:hypothetical protein
MRLGKQRPAPAPPPQDMTKPTGPSRQEFLDRQERPERDYLAAKHNGLVAPDLVQVHADRCGGSACERLSSWRPVLMMSPSTAAAYGLIQPLSR